MNSPVPSCVHVLGEDPRNLESRTCIKCGRRVPVERVMERDPDFELAVLRDAAQSVGLEHVADSLRRFADERAEPGPVRLWHGRDLLNEWLEEEADGAGNYGPWLLQLSILDGDEDDATPYLQEALRGSIIVYNALLKAKAARG